MEQAAFQSINENTSSQPRPSIFASRTSFMSWIKSLLDSSSLVFQLFYFFYFAAFGSLFPLISIYFKQLGLNPIQCGILNGSRSLIDCLITPFWSALAGKWKKGKAFLICSLIGSICFTLGIGFVRPRPEGCLVRVPAYGLQNMSYENQVKPLLTLIEPYRALRTSDLKSVDMTRDLALNFTNRFGQTPLYLNIKKLIPPSKLEKATENREYYTKASIFHDPTHYPQGSLVMPLYSTVVYSQTKINQVFIILLILIVFGELVSCPAVPLVDALVAERSAEIEHDNTYGRQRMFGSVGWGLAMFFIGLALDNASSFPDYPCLQPGYRERNYMVCFATYSVFMAFTLVTATQIKFAYEGSQESMYFKLVKDKMAKTLLGRTTTNRSKLVNELDDDLTEKPTQQTPGPTNEEILERQLGIKIDAVQTKGSVFEPEPIRESYLTAASVKITKWTQAMKAFSKPQLLVFLFVTWFMGLGVGQVFTFLFWHMQEFDGSPTLFGIATVINHVSEIVMFHFSKQLIDKIGHLRVLYLGLIGNVVRFLYVSWITNPWWILPFEFLQGLTHAGVWVACCSYISQAFPAEMRLTVQGFLHGVHYGLGRGLGAIFGGLVIASYGSAAMFRSYGAASAIVLLAFLVLNYFMPIPVGPTESTEEASFTGSKGELDEKAVESYGKVTSDATFGQQFQASEPTHEYYKQLNRNY